MRCHFKLGNIFPYLIDCPAPHGQRLFTRLVENMSTFIGFHIGAASGNIMTFIIRPSSDIRAWGFFNANVTNTIV